MKARETEHMIEKLHNISAAFSEKEISHLDKQCAFNEEGWKRYADSGLLEYCADAFSSDGAQLPSDALRLLFELGKSCPDNGLSFAIGVHILAGISVIRTQGSTFIKENYLSSVLKGSKICCHAITEKESGSDVFRMHTSAERTANESFTLTGEKNYISLLPVADLIIVYVLTDAAKGFLGGITCFLLDKEQHTGLLVDKEMPFGLRTCPIGTLRMNKIDVDTKNVIGKIGGGAMIFQQAIILERIGLSAVHLGTCDAMIAEAVNHVNDRKVGGKNLGNHQAISHTLADLYAELEACKAILHQIGAIMDRGEKVDMHAPIVKVKVSELYKTMAQQVMQIHGAYGYVHSGRLRRCLRDAVGSTLYSGSSEIQKNIIARYMGIK